MILFDILQLQRKQFFRSSFFGQGLAIKILLGLFGLYMLSMVLLLTFVLPEILHSISKDKPSYVVFTSILLYYLAFDIIIRYFLQKLATLDLEKFLLTPLKKSTIFHFSLTGSIFNFFNLFGWILLIPFAWQVIIPELGIGIGINWMLGMLSLPVIAHFATMYLKRIEVVSNFKGIFILGIIVLLGFMDYMGWISIIKVSEFIFKPLFSSPILWIIYWVLAGLLYVLNFRLLSAYSHLDDWFTDDKSAAGIGKLDWLEQKGTTSAILANELKLILRNKRTKSALWLSLFILLYPLIFYTNPELDSNYWKVFIGVFVSGIFMINYGQFMISWESAGFDGLLTRNIPAAKYFQAKFILIVGSCIIMFVLSTPYFIFYDNLFLPHFASLLYNLGINSYFLLWASTYNKKKIDLSKGSMMNYQGTGATQFLIAIPLFCGPFLIIAIPLGLGMDNLAWIILGTLSLLSLALHKFWMKGIIANFNERKFLTAEGFRQKA
jgi:hypothetical protein